MNDEDRAQLREHLVKIRNQTAVAALAWAVLLALTVYWDLELGSVIAIVGGLICLTLVTLQSMAIERLDS